MHRVFALAVLSTSCIYVDAPARPEHALTVESIRSSIVFVTSRDSEDRWSRPQLYLSDLTGGNAINLTNDAYSNGSPAISPDGRQLVFVSSRAGAPKLFVMSLDGGEARELVTSVGPIQSPHWSGGHIAFEAPANAPETAVWLVADGDRPQRLTTPPSNQRDDGGLAFIDHGRRIVFSRFDEQTHDRDLYVVTVDGSKVSRITETPHVTETLPVASHDGRLLAYRATRMGPDSGESIRIIAIDGWSLVRDIPLPSPAHSNISGIDFTAGDRSLVFGADATDVGGSLQNLHGEIFAIDVDGTHLRRITKNAAYDGQPVTVSR
jgi:Tol biopolymer transport system component